MPYSAQRTQALGRCRGMHGHSARRHTRPAVRASARRATTTCRRRVQRPAPQLPAWQRSSRADSGVTRRGTYSVYGTEQIYLHVLVDPTHQYRLYSIRADRLFE